MESMPAKPKKDRHRKKQRERIAAKDIDPYFGDMTKIQPAKSQPVKTHINYSSTSTQLFEVFPQTDKKLINLLLEENNGNFEIVFDALLKINSEQSTESPKISEKLETKAPVINPKPPPIKTEDPIPNSLPEASKNSIKPEKNQPVEGKIEDEKKIKEISKSGEKHEDEEEKLENLENDEPEEPITEEYKAGIDKMALESIALNFIENYPR